ncbi:toll/interleukin-1 receptor domain-containing protein [Nostoc sp. PA-18-2419]|uniref:toll/interleukin-1 receptor domain-containing protein n=1 Tax=Nostoc sp. PA-18-2419 TaxID=2575443 RepID=UPI001109525E|nr:toll/interleukin-1 receptor domain-containing protein [Nostoc sp. PA-18-2419]
MTAESKKVFISYAWGGDSEEFVNRLDQALQKKGITIVRDKRDLGYKGLIKEFMKYIGCGKCVVVVISDKYLKSPNCMFELLEISKNGQFYDRVFPITLLDAKIYDPVDRCDYIIHWDNQIQRLDSKLRLVASSANLINLQQVVTQYTEFRATIDILIYMLQNMNTLTPDIHNKSDFEALLEAIEHQLSDSVLSQQAFSSAETSINSSNTLIAETSNINNGITVEQFVNNQATLADQFTFFVKQIGVESLRQDYAKSKFETYSNTWKSLQALRLAGNKLWEQASEENLIRFAEQLDITTRVAYEGGIFLEELDYIPLFSVLEIFGNFRLGKWRLIEFSSRQDIESAISHGVVEQQHISELINQNQSIKRKYEEILDNIRVSFRQKLSGQLKNTVSDVA